MNISDYAGSAEWTALQGSSVGAVLAHCYHANVGKLDRGLILVFHEVIDINKLAPISRMGD
ncbi:uncharacterized protein N7511_007012 [Penicillium nucicola]|uniref:uncharacterized protein n=1 Tax=Penicillium nucicola TaxID=1850975 RepID=UPI00254522BF|nr:uncharacterized protein N7511_007012 [Penicillium nucicola]KAJ5758318.1 hypothetical protein N7511_007012 [Penicillium nucicola]